VFKNNKSLLIITLIAVVNTLGYGIVFPIIYSYSQRFGLSDFQNGLLFSVFSICQFLSAPIIGRWSDKYGRKPLLLISLIGTVISFLLMAWAPSAIFLFIARALDGLTAGNFPVATAVISDTTKPEDRAKGFGIIGAAFGFGFVFGPAISALTIGFGPSVPFLIAAIITAVAVILTWIILPETNKHLGHTHEGKLFDFVKLAKAVIDPNVGKTLLISLIYSFSFGLLIFAYQPFAVKILNLTPSQVAFLFTIFGIVGFISQALIIPRTVKRVEDKKLLINSLILSAFAFLGFFLTRSYAVFIVVSIVLALANAFVNPLIQSLLSKETDEKSQGEIMGVNASYVSIGSIFGPILGGALATLSIPSPFLAGSIFAVICAVIAFQIFRQSRPKQISL
jgi:MFS family permease